MWLRIKSGMCESALKTVKVEGLCLLFNILRTQRHLKNSLKTDFVFLMQALAYLYLSFD